MVEADEIDRINIFAATMLAMTRAVAGLVAQLTAEPDEVLIDGNKTPAGRVPEWRWNARAIVGGDALEPCISAASILAKEHRDRLMREYAARALQREHEIIPDRVFRIDARGLKFPADAQAVNLVFVEGGEVV